MRTGQFSEMALSTDEDEHSIEMHLPFIAQVMQGCIYIIMIWRIDVISRAFTIVPILVGAIDHRKEATFGQLLAPYLEDPDNFFVVSSDFCHWGPRFDYFYRPQESAPNEPLHQAIEMLDRQAMGMIERQAITEFEDYLKRTRNTICGRHPIGVLLNALAALREQRQVQIKFIKYAQSNAASSMRDNSVSYASAIVTIE